MHLSASDLRSILLNTQRTVQAFRGLLAYTEWQLSTESQIRGKELTELCRIERERDNARAALVECQKLNATLRQTVANIDDMYARCRGDRNELREQLATVTSQRDRAMELIADVCEFGDNDASHKQADALMQEIEKETK